MADRNIAQEPWYHGLLPREDIQMMLRRNGDFIVRSSEPVSGQPRQYVLSVMLKDEDDGIKHFVLREGTGGKIFIETQGFDTISKLVDHHYTTKEPISKTAILRTPIVRQSWELAHEDVVLTKKLGEGAFGEVWKGQLTLKATGKVTDVAVKSAKLESLNKEQIKEIMHEARLMRFLDHPNVVKFYGVAAGQEPLYVIMELADCGALNSYLQKNTFPVSKKLEMIYQAACGISYIHEKNMLHRDIAARNCLYGAGQVKIADFGLSREGTVYQMDMSKKVPIRWLAPETLRSGLYTPKSDVFAFGIMSWEIFENGKEPYPGMVVADVVSQVNNGYRMQFQDDVPAELVQYLTKKCWAENPSDRVSMREVVSFMQRVFKFKPVRESSMSLARSIKRWTMSTRVKKPTSLTSRAVKVDSLSPVAKSPTGASSSSKVSSNKKESKKGFSMFKCKKSQEIGSSTEKEKESSRKENVKDSKLST